jgi:uncharacterized protein (DUF1697 family)
MSGHTCVFLRGVNVGGIKLKMEELKKAFAALSFPDAKTVLASGNVIIPDDGRDRAALKSEIEAALSGAFNYDANVFLRSAFELRSVLAASKTVTLPPDCHLYYLICDSRDALGELDKLFTTLPHKAGETYIPLESGAFWIVPVGETLESAFGTKVLGDKKYKSLLTSRTIGTVEKILAAMDAPMS